LHHIGLNDYLSREGVDADAPGAEDLNTMMAIQDPAVGSRFQAGLSAGREGFEKLFGGLPAQADHFYLTERLVRATECRQALKLLAASLPEVA
jgi:hypothetical protein